MPAVSTKTYSAPSRVDRFVHGVAGGAGDGRNDGALLPGEGVEQGRFAHVGAADDGHLDGLSAAGSASGAGSLREAGGDVVEQGVDADAVLGRDREDVGDSQP